MKLPKVYPHIYLTDPISLHGIHPAVPGGNRKAGFCRIIPAVWSSGPADSGESVLLAYAASDPKARHSESHQNNIPKLWSFLILVLFAALNLLLLFWLTFMIFLTFLMG